MFLTAAVWSGVADALNLGEGQKKRYQFKYHRVSPFINLIVLDFVEQIFHLVNALITISRNLTVFFTHFHQGVDPYSVMSGVDPRIITFRMTFDIIKCKSTMWYLFSIFLVSSLFPFSSFSCFISFVGLLAVILFILVVALEFIEHIFTFSQSTFK